MTDAASIAQKVLAAESAPGATLSLAPGMAPVTVDTPVADARRNYMRLAVLIHPDKLKGSFDKATEAFQMLVRAFETFADPKARKKAFNEAAAAASAGRVRKSASERATKPLKKKARPEKAKTKAKAKPAKKKPSRKAARGSDDDSEDVSSSESASESEEEEESAEEAVSDDDEEEFHFSDDDAVEPTVSNSRTPIGEARTGPDYTMTIIGCPNCRSRWEPDTRQQYSLFMGEWGKKVHCQLCLLVFGSATALHNCPHCQASFDYDASMYESVFNCQRCKHRIGFPYYPVSQHLIDQVRLEEWRARKEAERAQERERRHRGRHDDAGDPAAAAEAQMQMWVGACVVNEECPLCHARVRRQHRQHVESCAKTHGPNAANAESAATAPPPPPPVKRAAAARKSATTAKAQPTPAVAKKVAAPKKKPASPAKPKAAATVAKAAKKKTPTTGKKTKRRGSSSDDEDDGDDEDSFSDDDDDESDASESSFDENPSSSDDE